MATMITAECINCGACEPECPNNAISQGEDLYVIDPLLCTECVGFHDFEACAAVCPVDCCVTDPNNNETEQTLITRARSIHPEVQFTQNFESRFRKADKKETSGDDQKQVPRPPRPAMEPATADMSKDKRVEVKIESQPLQKTTPPEPVVPSKTPRVPKKFSGELPIKVRDAVLERGRKGVFPGALQRTLVFVLQPLLGALPHAVKKELETAVGNPVFFSAAGATGLNILLNLFLYPVLFIVLAAGLSGAGILFSSSINVFILLGVGLGFAEALYRLKDGVFHAKAPAEMIFREAIYGIGLAGIVRSLLQKRMGILRHTPIPVDGFYQPGFVDKVERERRYGNVYILQDWGDSYFLRMEFPRKVPDIGPPVTLGLPEEMPDYDYELALKNGTFIVKGKCTDEKIRKISSSVGAFPPEFTTVIRLHEKVEGFAHQYENKLLEVVLPKERGRNQENA